MKLYLAGPMSGIESHNYPAFHNAAEKLRKDGHEVISPAELHPDAANIQGESTPEDYRKYLAADFAAIAECDALALLPGFANSRGARLEIHYALTMGMPCHLFSGTQLWTAYESDFLMALISSKTPRGAATDVFYERSRQDAKWGEQNHADVWWSAILGEEFGEVSQAILHDEFGGKAAGTTRAELVQLAAVALAWIECIDRRAKRVTP